MAARLYHKHYGIESVSQYDAFIPRIDTPLSQTGLRFFTVYGPWGRPDMAAYQFANKYATEVLSHIPSHLHSIVHSEGIKLFDNPSLSRDFTFIDDTVSGIIGGQ